MANSTLKLSLLFLSIALANNATYAESSPAPFPLMPRALGEVFFGDRTLGEADAMLPLFGNQEGIFYLDGLGKTGSDDGSLASIGGGYRGIRNHNYLWGAYLFGDFNRVAEGPHFSVINPGLELMTNLWDVHVNGYFPTTKQKIRGSFLGEQIGTTQYVRFSGHNQYDNLINLVEEVGNGVDGEIGLTPPETNYLRLFAGSYHFSFKEAQNINGVIGGVEMPLNQYLTVSVRDSYDRVQKNTALLTIRLTLGGIAKGEQRNIHDRLLDPIPRHLGTWDTGSGIPGQQAYVNTGVPVLTRSNIWFFSNAGTPFVAANGFSNCTFENNCSNTSFNQLTLDAIDNLSPKANLYLGHGIYNTISSGTFKSNALLSTLVLNQGQSIYGRNGDFKSREKELIAGNLILTGDDVIDSISLVNVDGENPVGLLINGANIRVTNSDIGRYSNTSGFTTAVDIEEANNVTIANSNIIGYVEDDVSNALAVGIRIGNSTNIHLLDNNILVESRQHVPVSALAQGIFVLRSQGIEIQNRRLDVQAWNLGREPGTSAFAEGIIMSESQATILKSSLTPERIPEEPLFNFTSVSSAFNVFAYNVGGEGNSSFARGIFINQGVASVNYNLGVASTEGDPRNTIQITATNVGGNMNIVGASGIDVFFDASADVKGVHLNVDGDDFGGNGFVTIAGYDVGANSVEPGLSTLNLGPSVNIIRAGAHDSSIATLNASGINLYQGGQITSGFDVSKFFVVTENGKPVTPIRAVS